MKPLRITARLQDVIALTFGSLAFDALLAALYAMVNRLPPIAQGVIPAPLLLPLANEPGGRFDLASFSVATFDSHEVTYFHKAFPQREAKHMSRMKRVDIAAGPNKMHRRPVSIAHAESDMLTWWCIGDQREIEELLQFCHHLGKRRGVGLGKVLQWSVEECEPWGDGFPVMLQGKALRNLPADWPGLVEPDLRIARLTYPYWSNVPGQVLCAVPEGDV